MQGGRLLNASPKHMKIVVIGQKYRVWLGIGFERTGTAIRQEDEGWIMRWQDGTTDWIREYDITAKA